MTSISRTRRRYGVDNEWVWWLFGWEINRGQSMIRVLRYIGLVCGLVGVGSGVEVKRHDVDEVVIKAVEKGAIKVDGVLNEEEWGDDGWYDSFYRFNQGRVVAEFPTYFKVLCDGENLYIGARMADVQPGRMRIEEFRHDGRVGDDDYFEFMLDPYGDRADFYHLVVNPAGVLYDSKRTHGGEFSNKEWDSGVVVKTKIGPKEWVVEMALPLARLDLSEKSVKERWNFNVVRGRKGDKVEVSSFWPVEKKNTDARYFGRLKFERGIDLSCYLLDIAGPYGTRVELRGGEWVHSGHIYVRNFGSEKDRFRCAFTQLTGRAAFFQLKEGVIGVKKGERVKVPYEVRVEKQDPVELSISLIDEKDINRVYKSRDVRVGVSYAALNVVLLQPWYRASIYATDKIDKLVVRVETVLSHEVLEKSRLNLSLVDKGGDIVAERLYNGVRSGMEYELEIPYLGVGEYRLEARLMKGDGSVLEKHNQVIRKLKEKGDEWRVGRNGEVLHNGKLFVPTGWFRVLPGEIKMQEGVFNVIFSPKERVFSDEEIIEYLDSMSNAGVYGVVSPYTLLKMYDDKREAGRVFTNEELTAIRRRVNLVKNHPALMGWWLGYQPEQHGVLVKRLQQVYSIMKEEDPYHPCIVINSRVFGLVTYFEIGDIGMPMLLIPFKEGGGPTRPLSSLAYLLEVAQKKGKRGLMVALQASNYSNANDLDTRAPNFIELRNLMYQAYIEGSKGFIWNDFTHSYNYADISEGVPFLAKELRVIMRSIGMEKRDDEVKVESGVRNSMYHTLRVGKKGKVYFVVVNTSDEKQDGVFKSEVFKEGERYWVLAEGREVRVGPGGEIRDGFEGKGVHVYLSFDPGVDDTFNVKEVLGEIEGEYAARKKSGNLIFNGCENVVIKASSGNFPNLLRRMVDGVFDGLMWSSDVGSVMPQWVEMKWENEVKVGRVSVFSDTIERAELLVWVDTKWRPVGQLRRVSGGELQVQFSEMETKGIRILVTKKRAGVNKVSISEVEVFRH